MLRMQENFGLWHPEHLWDIENMIWIAEQKGGDTPFGRAFDRFLTGRNYDEWKAGLTIDTEYMSPDYIPGSPFAPSK